MIQNFITKISQEEQSAGSSPLYIRSSLKEYLQIVILQYIYTTSEYKSNLIFTGGTCLRHFFGIERLSEDLDFDYIKPVNSEEFAEKIGDYFETSLKYPDLKISLKQQGRQVLLKFPVLQAAGIAEKNESDLLYIKIDFSPTSGSGYNTEKTAKSAYGYNFVAMHYDLPSLFSGKISAILTRNLLTGKDDKKTIKGRDFYDLLWYLKNSVSPNLDFIRERMANPNLNIEELKDLVGKKVNAACTTYKNDFKNDLMPFIRNQNFISDYVDNYLEEYSRYRI